MFESYGVEAEPNTFNLSSRSLRNLFFGSIPLTAFKMIYDVNERKRTMGSTFSGGI